MAVPVFHSPDMWAGQSFSRGLSTLHKQSRAQEFFSSSICLELSRAPVPLRSAAALNDTLS